MEKEFDFHRIEAENIKFFKPMEYKDMSNFIWWSLRKAYAVLWRQLNRTEVKASEIERCCVATDNTIQNTEYNLMGDFSKLYLTENGILMLVVSYECDKLGNDSPDEYYRCD